jgi:hypothetical protein
MRRVQNSIPMTLITFLVLSLAIAFLWTQGIMSARVLGVAYLVLVGFLTYAVAKILMKKVNDPQISLQISANSLDVKRPLIRRLKVAVIVLPILLVVGLLATRGQPLLPRLVGASINILLTGWVVSILLRVRKARENCPK